MEDFPFLGYAIANVITKLRENAGLSKRKLAVLTGIDRVYILQVEQGKYRPTVNFMFLLAKGLGVEPTAIFEMVATEQQRLEEEERRKE